MYNFPTSHSYVLLLLHTRFKKKIAKQSNWNWPNKNSQVHMCMSRQSPHSKIAQHTTNHVSIFTTNMYHNNNSSRHSIILYFFSSIQYATSENFMSHLSVSHNTFIFFWLLLFVALLKFVSFFFLNSQNIWLWEVDKNYIKYNKEIVKKD